jgi:exonuclease III
MLMMSCSYKKFACTNSLDVAGYDINVNVGSAMRGTVIMARRHIPLTNVVSLLSERAMAAKYKGLLLVNIYAPSGTAKRDEREHFYNTDFPKLLRFDHPHILIGGYFNCAIETVDTTGHLQNSHTLTEMVLGLELKDAWSQDLSRPTYTCYHSKGASRLDRFYLTEDLHTRKTGIAVLPAAFTDHFVVELRLGIVDPIQMEDTSETYE